MNIRAPRADQHKTLPDPSRESASPRRRRSRIATRRAAAELAAHRRRLLEVATDADPSDAMLLSIDPREHRRGIVRIATTPLTGHLTPISAYPHRPSAAVSAPSSASTLEVVDRAPAQVALTAQGFRGIGATPGGSGHGSEAEASQQSKSDSSCASEPKTSIRRQAARSPVVMSAAERGQSSRRLLQGEAAGSNSTAQAAGATNLDTNVNVNKKEPLLTAPQGSGWQGPKGLGESL